MKKELIFDSSTAILLAKIGMIEIAAEKIGIIFSEKVEEETTKKKDCFDSIIIKRLVSEGRIKVKKSDEQKTRKLIEDFNIERGEAESLELAREKRYILATDDGPSIKICKLLGVRFTTAIHFLVTFYKNGLLDKGIALEKLKSLERYGRYSYDILKDAKNRIGGE